MKCTPEEAAAMRKEIDLSKPPKGAEYAICEECGRPHLSALRCDHQPHHRERQTAPVHIALQICETCGYKALSPVVCPDHPGTCHRSVPYIWMRQHQDHMAGKDESIAVLRKQLRDTENAVAHYRFRLEDGRYNTTATAAPLGPVEKLRLWLGRKLIG